MGASSRRITSLIRESLHFVSQHNLCSSNIRALVQRTTTDKAFLFFSVSAQSPDGSSRCAWWWHDVFISFHCAVAASHPLLLIHPEAPTAIALRATSVIPVLVWSFYIQHYLRDLDDKDVLSEPDDAPKRALRIIRSTDPSHCLAVFSLRVGPAQRQNPRPAIVTAKISQSSVVFSKPREDGDTTREKCRSFFQFGASLIVVSSTKVFVVVGRLQLPTS
ncbi:hypothetical protein GGI43DRAFT_14787 [Trichoderma evansii]